MKATDDNEQEYVCAICGKPILDGQARYTGLDYKGIFHHWDCYEPELKRHKAMVEKLLGDDKPTRKPRRREGEGATAQKIARMLAEAVKRDLGLTVDPEDFAFWVQPPAYRGPRWDLATWGASITNPELPNLKLVFHSWSSMTSLAKNKALRLSHEGGLHYDVFAG